MENTGNESVLGGRKFIALDNKNNKFEFNFEDEDKVFLNKEELDINIVEEDGITHVEYQGCSYPIEIVEKNQNKCVILINGVSYSFTIETPISYKRKKFLEKNQVESKTESVLAPMPGKILDIMVDEDQLVKEGDSLLILEAMKMQNEILAPIAGKIKKIFVRKDENVMKDDIMIEIEK